MEHSEDRYQELTRYIRLRDHDLVVLEGLGRVTRPIFANLADAFYERTREHEELHSVFQDEAQVARLKVSLVRWMEQFFFSPRSEDYWASRARIGRTHIAVGVPQRFVVAAMSQIRETFEARCAEVEDSFEALSALNRALDLELSVILDGYRAVYETRIDRVEEATERGLVPEAKHYIRAVELAPLIIIGLDSRGLVRFFSREAEQMTGLKVDEVLGKPFVDVLLPEHVRNEARDLLVRRSDVEGGVEWETDLKARSGRLKRVALQLNDIAHDDVSLFAIGRDVTEERLRQKRSAQTERLAAVGTLAAGLAHEIRNPLNGALLHVTFLERALAKHSVGPEAEDAVRLVGDEVRRLSSLVKDFLVFARPSASRVSRTDLGKLVERVVGILRADAEEVGAELMIDASLSELIVNVDGSKIEQALLNLGRNAIDAIASQSGGHVIFRTRREPWCVALDIEDDGPGLPSPDAPIFDAFFTTKANGTGLGLAIAHRAVTDHGGSIDVMSRPGQTVFRIVLPLDTMEAA